MKYVRAVLVLVVGVAGLGGRRTNWPDRVKARVSQHLWPDKVIPVNISKDGETAEYGRLLCDAISHLNDNSCLLFRALEPEEARPHLLVKTSQRGPCQTSRGYSPDRFTQHQVLLLTPACWESKWKLMHYLLQAAGLFPEQRHYDRDKLLEVFPSRVQPHHRRQYARFSGGYGYYLAQGLPYNPNSLMHYAPDAFALKEDSPTMQLREGSGSLGQRTHLNLTDLARLNRLYRCMEHPLGDEVQGGVPYLFWRDELVWPYR